jgi:Protein of unknown function (DUF3379)
MNCLDYRRVLLAGEGETAEMSQHRLRCTACADLAAEHAVFESALKSALEVPVPAQLETTLIKAATARRRRFLAAAGVAAIAAGGGAFAWLRRDDPLALACIDFVMKEEAKSIMMGAMPREEARAALAGTLPLERIEKVGQVRHVGPCPFNGQMAYHVVLAVPQGKVTLLVMPETAMDARASAVHEGMHAAVIGIGRGSVGVVAADAGVLRSVSSGLRG